jgi:hypothetical protein
MKRALVGVSLLAAVAALAGASGFIRSHLTSASAASPPVLASGTILEPDGAPLVNGTVDLYLEPAPSTTTSTLGALMQHLGSAVTDANGDYAIAVADSPTIDAAGVWNNGQINVQLIASDGSYTYETEFPRTFQNGAWTGGSTSRYARVRPTTLRMPAASRIRMTSWQKHAFAADHTLTPKVYNPGGCLGPYESDTGNGEEDATTVGELHAANDMAKDSFKYGTESDSSIDVGFSSSNTSGDWSIDGSIGFTTGGSGSASSTDPINQSLFGHRLWVYVTYEKYLEHWVPAGCVHSQWKIKPLGWNFGIHTGQDNSNLDGHCTTTYAKFLADLPPGQPADRTKNKYVKFSAAATLGLGTGGLSIGAQSGMSQYVEQHWVAGTNQQHHYLCGNDNPTSDSSRIFAGS